MSTIGTLGASTGLTCSSTKVNTDIFVTLDKSNFGYRIISPVGVIFFKEPGIVPSLKLADSNKDFIWYPEHRTYFDNQQNGE